VQIVGMIPVRLESTRLPEKALALIQNIPMILHTWKRCSFSKLLTDLYVVTDSEKIKDLICSHGGKVIMTRSDHLSGSDRLAEAVANLDVDVVINIQGDEALVDPCHIDKLIRNFIGNDSPVGLLATKYSKVNSPSDIKLVVNEKSNVMYASRADIPFSKNGQKNDFLKAYHVVAFQKDFLMRYSSWQPTQLELIEGNEYLRILEKGYSISVTEVSSSAISVDTPDDLAFVEDKMKVDNLFRVYGEALLSWPTHLRASFKN